MIVKIPKKDLISSKTLKSDNKLTNKHKTNIPNKFIPAMMKCSARLIFNLLKIRKAFTANNGTNPNRINFTFFDKKFINCIPSFVFLETDGGFSS